MLDKKPVGYNTSPILCHGLYQLNNAGALSWSFKTDTTAYLVHKLFALVRYHNSCPTISTLYHLIGTEMWQQIWHPCQGERNLRPLKKEIYNSNDEAVSSLGQ